MNSPTILCVVEDERTVGSSLRTLLENTGFEVLTARGAEQGLKIIQEQLPTVVLIDIGTTSRDDLRLLGSIRANSRLSDVRVVMLGGDGYGLDIVTALEAGADDVIVWPFTPREILARVRALLRRVRWRQSPGE